MRSSNPTPTVSIGLPVFNGENFLEDAIRSVLGQTLDDLELIISDNASADRTPEICWDYAGRDPRVRYFRNARNLGAASNYNRTFEHARGRYFKWLAHDDRIAPGYLAATVAALDAHPDAVLCNTVVDYIDAQGELLALYKTVLGDADRPEPSRRLATMILRSHSCVDFFGLIRRESMLGSLLHGTFPNADRAFIAQMALRGRLMQLPEPLVQMREHRDRYARRQMTATGRLAWHDPAHAAWLSFPTCRLFGEYLRLVRNEALPPGERARCYAVLAQWWFRNWNLMRAGVDIIAVCAPRTVGFAEELKARLFGAAPGHYVDRNTYRYRD